MGLRMRLTLLFSTAVVGLAFAGGVLLVDQLVIGMNAALDSSLTVRADALAQQVGPGGTVADFQDGPGVTSILSPVDTLAQVIGPDGRPIESSEGAGAVPLLTTAQLARARSGPVAFTASLPQADPVRLLAMPVPGTGPRPAVVVVGTGGQVVVAAVHRAQAAAWIGGPVAALLGGLGAWLLAGAVLRPVERMRVEAAAISAGDTGARLAVPARHDEIARLGETINSLLGRLQDALARQRRFVADAGHELRTPLTALRTELELAGRPGRDRASLAASVDAAAQDTDRLIRLAEDLLVMARADDSSATIHHGPVRLDEVVREAARSARGAATRRGVHLNVPTVGSVWVRGDRDRLRRVIGNLIDNAVRHSPVGGIITLQAFAERDTRRVIVRVLDRGSGFPPEFLPRAFDRFARGDVARTGGAGTGLGLAIVASLVQEHGGTVVARNRSGGGAEVEVALPAPGEADGAASPRRPDVNAHMILTPSSQALDTSIEGHQPDDGSGGHQT